MFTPLLNHIQKFVMLTDDEQTTLIRHFSYIEVKKKDFLFTEGQLCNAQFFVIQGCVRLYFVKENGQEQITHFGIDNWWISDYTSLDLQKPSAFYLQAVESSKLAVLSRANQEKLLLQLPNLERYFRIIFQRIHATSQMRMRYLYDLSSEEQYHHFADTFPDFVQRVPQYMLASYLGFTPEFLSKIRAKKR